MRALNPAPATRALTPEQEQAVARRSEPLLVSAGAGSGKTAVLVERFVRAVRDDGVSPARILAITFTDRAAGELRDRVRARLLELGEREAARDTEAAFVSTFHRFCTRLLRSHALSVGLQPHFRILDEGLAAALRERAFTLALGGFLEGERTAAVDLVAAYGADRLQAMLWRTYAELRSRGHSRPRLPPARAARASPSEREDGLDARAAAACGLLDELLGRFGRCYEALKQARGAADFDDLELRALELLQRRPHVRAAWSERFELVMVDEFQDTNPRQLAILRALERENLFTVGDELQSIYGFRDADVRLFRERRAELARRGLSLELTRNFRSSSSLLEVINGVFEARLGERYTPLVAARARPQGNGAAPAREPAVELLLTSKRGWNGDDEADEAGNGARTGTGPPPWRRAEARALAERVAELVRGGEAAPAEVAVLLRAVGDIETYERALREQGLNTLATAGGFWARQEVGDLLTYLRALANPLDELALYGTLAGPLVGLSSDGLALLARAAQARREPAWCGVRRDLEQLRARLSERDGARLGAFAEHFERERRSAPTRATSRLIERAWRDGGYESHVRGLDAAEERVANVHKLLRLARRFEAGEGRDLRGFLDHVTRQEALASAPEADAPVAGVEPDAVRLMSIHAAKGLEFTVVCIADLGRALNLAVPDLLVDRDRVGLRLAQLDGSEAQPALAFEELGQERRCAQAEEEERIVYVAMTRARERLLLSGAVSFERWPEARQAGPAIAWLGPALVPGLPEIVRDHPCSTQAPLELPAGGAPGARVRCTLNAPQPRAADTARASAAAAQRASAFEAEPASIPAEARVDAQPTGQRGAAHPEQLALKLAAPPAPLPMLEEGESLSYTALAQLSRCAYRFYLERVLGLPENRAGARGHGARDGLDARARGAIVHRLLESVDFRRPEPRSAAQSAAAARELGLRASRVECEELAALASAATGTAAAAGPAARLAAAEDVRREHPFAFSLGAGEPLFTGVIDVLARERHGGFLVVDYKTDRVDAAEPLAEVVERDYELQRVIYALAVLGARAPAVDVVHWFLHRPAEWVSARFQARDRDALQRRLAQRLRHARERGYAVSELPHRALCETCPGRLGLCSWSDAETLRERPSLVAREGAR